MLRSTSIFLVILAIGCSRPAPADRVTMVDDDDAKMNAAIDQARATVESFANALKAPQPGQSEFSVKMAFRDGDKTEHMWLAPVTLDGGRFRGTVNNDPEMVKNVKIGDSAEIAVAEISDWMFIDHGKLIGGYTLRVLRDAMSAKERAELDGSVPFKFE